MVENTPKSPTPPLVAALVLGIATIAGAWFFELIIGLAPCPLCLNQRWPYYIGLAILLVVVILFKKARMGMVMAGIGAVGLIFLAGAFYAGFHAGVEWHFWQGPADCSGGQDLSASVGNLLQTLKTAKVVSCVEAAWRLFGISLAGYNVIISTLITTLCLIAYKRLQGFPIAEN